MNQFGEPSSSTASTQGGMYLWLPACTLPIRVMREHAYVHKELYSAACKAQVNDQAEEELTMSRNPSYAVLPRNRSCAAGRIICSSRAFVLR
jgi:hypothetical protein